MRRNCLNITMRDAARCDGGLTVVSNDKARTVGCEVGLGHYDRRERPYVDGVRLRRVDDTLSHCAATYHLLTTPSVLTWHQ